MKDATNDVMDFRSKKDLGISRYSFYATILTFWIYRYNILIFWNNAYPWNNINIAVAIIPQVSLLS